MLKRPTMYRGFFVCKILTYNFYQIINENAMIFLFYFIHNSLILSN